MNGGYILLDCKGFDVSKETAQTIAGLNAACATAIGTGKTIIACNLAGTGEVQAVAVEPGTSGAYVITLTGGTQINVSSADSAQVVADEAAPEGNTES